MRIALLTDGLFPDVIGGMQKHSFFLARYMARAGVVVDLYYTAPKEDHRQAFAQFSQAEKDNINAIYIPFPSRGFLPGHYLKESLAFSARIHRKWRQRPQVDLIYAQGFTGWYFAERHDKGQLETPLAVNLHGLEMFQVAFGFKAKLQQYLLKGPAKYIVNHADLVYSLGGKLTQILKREMKHPERIAEQAIGIDSSWLRADIANEESGLPRRFVFVGRYEKRKGLDVLNRVMAQVSPEIATFHLVGPIEASVQIQAPHIHYEGLIREEGEMQVLLDGCDVLLCPSFAEGMPTVILEAMSRGLAVIASDVGAVCELVGERTGWLIPPGDEVALRAAIEDAAKQPLLEKKKAARALITERFVWDRTIQSTLNTLKERFKMSV